MTYYALYPGVKVGWKLSIDGTQEAAEYVTCRKTTKTHRKTTSTYNIKMEFVLQKMSSTKKCWIKWYIENWKISFMNI